MDSQPAWPETGSNLPAPMTEIFILSGGWGGPPPSASRPSGRMTDDFLLRAISSSFQKIGPDFGPYRKYFTESLILAQDERWRRA